MSPNIPAQPGRDVNAPVNPVSQQSLGQKPPLINKSKWILLIIILLIVFFGGGIYYLEVKQFKQITPTPTVTQSSLVPTSNPQTTPKIAGGECKYKKYPGACKITGVDMIKKIVLFKFSPSNTPMDLKGTWANASGEADLLGRTYQEYPGYLNLTCLSGMSSFESSDLSKCGVNVDAVFNCNFNLITSGTCSPTTFEFSDSSLECAREGESPTYLDLTTGKKNPKGKQCCSGLREIMVKAPEASVKRGVCPGFQGTPDICSQCGNGICNSTYEDICNCPEDCK